MAAVKINNHEFKNRVLESDKPVLIDFWASWCMPCQRLLPVVEEFAEEHPEFLIGKANVDEEPELAKQFRVRSVPTLVVIKDGKEVKRAVGVLSEDDILELLS